jgi:signal transduction histidine kinase
MNGTDQHAAEASTSRRVPRGNRLSGALSRYSYTLLLILVFGTETAVGIFVIRDLRSGNLEAQQMYARSVLGLRQIGELQYQAQETRRSTLYALTTNDSNLQVEYADQSNLADDRVTQGIGDYLQEARTPQEIEVGRGLQEHWSAYHDIRKEVLASILEGSTKEAVNLDLTSGVPSFEVVRLDLEEIKRLYDEQASKSVGNVAASHRRSVVRLVAVLFFTLLFASVSVWAIQRSKVQSTLQLAKLQMNFVASVSHELRTPLTVICSAADNVADGVVGGKEQLGRYRSLIRSQSRQITELVNQLLLFASAQEHPVRYVLRPMSVSQIVESVVDGTMELVQGAGFVVEHRVEDGLPNINGDLSALVQCLQNLVANAVKYSGEARRISIRAYTGEAAGGGGKEVRISVQDRGIGIDPSEIARIFEPFYRSPAVTAAQIHGTGLGLPVARAIAEAMGGRLSVASELGIGSVFTLHLPIIVESNPHIAGVTHGSDLFSQK